jgi:hypothetical protein
MVHLSQFWIPVKGSCKDTAPVVLKLLQQLCCMIMVQQRYTFQSRRLPSGLALVAHHTTFN